MIYEKEGSFLEELDNLNIEVTFRDTLRASVQYAVLTRCGLDASRYLDEEDLRGMLCEVAWVIAGKRNTYLSAWYWRIKQKKGAKKAIVALARKLELEKHGYHVEAQS